MRTHIRTIASSVEYLEVHTITIALCRYDPRTTSTTNDHKAPATWGAAPTSITETNYQKPAPTESFPTLLPVGNSSFVTKPAPAKEDEESADSDMEKVVTRVTPHDCTWSDMVRVTTGQGHQPMSHDGSAATGTASLLPARSPPTIPSKMDRGSLQGGARLFQIALSSATSTPVKTPSYQPSSSISEQSLARTPSSPQIVARTPDACESKTTPEAPPVQDGKTPPVQDGKGGRDLSASIASASSAGPVSTASASSAGPVSTASASAGPVSTAVEENRRTDSDGSIEIVMSWKRGATTTPREEDAAQAARRNQPVLPPGLDAAQIARPNQPVLPPGLDAVAHAARPNQPALPPGLDAVGLPPGLDVVGLPPGLDVDVTTDHLRGHGDVTGLTGGMEAGFASSPPLAAEPDTTAPYDPAEAYNWGAWAQDPDSGVWYWFYPKWDEASGNYYAAKWDHESQGGYRYEDPPAEAKGGERSPEAKTVLARWGGGEETAGGGEETRGEGTNVVPSSPTEDLGDLHGAASLPGTEQSITEQTIPEQPPPTTGNSPSPRKSPKELSFAEMARLSPEEYEHYYSLTEEEVQASVQQVEHAGGKGNFSISTRGLFQQQKLAAGGGPSPEQMMFEKELAAAGPRPAYDSKTGAIVAVEKKGGTNNLTCWPEERAEEVGAGFLFKKERAEEVESGIPFAEVKSLRISCS